MIVVAIDIGGTFTDLIGFDTQAQRFLQAKSLTTPGNLVQGIIDCINKSGMTVGEAQDLIHGTTQAINTLIERKGARTALLVTKGTIIPPGSMVLGSPAKVVRPLTATEQAALSGWADKYVKVAAHHRRFE